MMRGVRVWRLQGWSFLKCATDRNRDVGRKSQFRENVEFSCRCVVFELSVFHSSEETAGI